MSNKTKANWLRFFLNLGPEILKIIGQLGIACMMLLVIADVLLRTFFNSPILGTTEVVTYWFMVALSFSGMWLAQTRKEHISVTMLTDKMSIQGKFLHRIFANLLTVIFLAAVGYYGWFNALDNMARGEFTGATHVVIWPMRFLVPIGMLAFIITVIIQTVKEIRGEVSLEDEEEISVGTQL